MSASCYSNLLCTMYAYSKDPSNAQAIPLEKTPGKDLFETYTPHSGLLHARLFRVLCFYFVISVSRMRHMWDVECLDCKHEISLLHL